MTSLPVPVSPISKTLVFRGETRRTSRNTSRMAGAFPIMSENGESLSLFDIVPAASDCLIVVQTACRDCMKNQKPPLYGLF
jgi:hypothetical protein